MKLLLLFLITGSCLIAKGQMSNITPIEEILRGEVNLEDIIIQVNNIVLPPRTINLKDHQIANGAFTLIFDYASTYYGATIYCIGGVKTQKINIIRITTRNSENRDNVIQDLRSKAYTQADPVLSKEIMNGADYMFVKKEIACFIYDRTEKEIIFISRGK